MAASAAKKPVRATMPPAIPQNHRLALQGPSFGTLTSATQELLTDYWSKVQAELAAEAELAADRDKLLTEGWGLSVGDVVAAGKELRARHALLTGRQTDLLQEKWACSKVLLPEFRRVVEELRVALDAASAEALKEITHLGLKTTHWGSRTARGFVLKILPLLQNKAPLTEALHQFETVTADLETIKVWAELGMRPVHSAVKIIWQPPSGEQALIVAGVASVAAAPVYPPVTR